MTITQEKINSIAQGYKKTGFLNKEKGLINAGYSHNYARALGMKLYDNVEVKEAIRLIQAENKVKNEINVEIQRQETIKLRDAAYDAKQYSAAITANDQLNKHAGFYALDNEQQSQSKALTEAQEAEYEEFIAWKRRQMLRPVKAG